jgi:hypothetical protein
MSRTRAVVLLVVLGLVALPALAHASPPDPTWISGLYDGGDCDDVVVAATSTPGATGGLTLAALDTLWVVLGAVPPHAPRGTASPVLAGFHGRAPPAR